MFRLLAAVAILALPATALAQQQPAGEPQSAAASRVRSVTLVGTERCPEARGDEIVVCSRIRPGDQYRIPPTLRHQGEEQLAVNQSWVNRTETIDNIGRQAGGLPNTCSPNGTGGQSGCALQALQAWTAERVANGRSASVLGR